MKHIQLDQGSIVTESRKAYLHLVNGHAFLVDTPPAGAAELDLQLHNLQMDYK
jgi:hypothetical protein